MLSSVCLSKMEKMPVSSRSSVIPMKKHKEDAAKSPRSSSRLSIFATIRRRTSRIFTHHKETPAVTPQLKKRQSWFDSVKTSRHIHHFHREDYCSEDARAEFDELTAMITGTTNSPIPSVPRSPVKRLLRTSSAMFLSLRGRRHDHTIAAEDEDRNQDEHEHEEEDNRSILTIRNNSFYKRDTPSVDLTLPLVCSSTDLDAGNRHSSFQLEVQKAVQDKVDQNFCLDEEGSTEPGPGVSFEGARDRSTLHVGTATMSGCRFAEIGSCGSTYPNPPQTPKSGCSTVDWSPLQSSDSESIVRHSGSEEDSTRTVSSVSDVCITACPREWERVFRSSDYIKDDRPNLSLSLLEGDSGLLASTPRLQHSRSLRDELLQVGELSHICEGDSISVGSELGDEHCCVRK